MLDLAWATKFLIERLKFLQRHNLWTKGIVVRTPRKTYFYVWTLKPLIDSLQAIAPLQRSINETGKPHPSVGYIRYEGRSIVRRLFRFAGFLKLTVLKDKKEIDYRLRRVLRRFSDKTRAFLQDVESSERQYQYEISWARQEAKSRRRQENIVQGQARWNGVLRSRGSYPENKSTGQERWTGVLRSRMS